MYTYRQSNGLLYHDALLISCGGSGRGDGFNNPAMENVPFVGPLPKGLYTMLSPVDHPKLGKVAIRLVPDAENEMYGRDDFWIHGWSAEEGLHESSDGCILMTKATRVGLASGLQEDDHLEVVL